MTLVFFGHFEGLFRSYLPANGLGFRVIDFLSVIGHQGVCFFLVLSGYFVYKSYLDNPGSYASLLLRRARRIYPPYAVMCGVYIVLSWLIPAESKIPAGRDAIPYLVGNFLLISPRPMITITWTIGTLLMVYTVLPACWAALRWERWTPTYRVLLILAGTAIWQYMPPSLPMFNPRVTALFVGFLLYEALRAGTRFNVAGEFPALGILACGYVLWYVCDHGLTGTLPLSKIWMHYISLMPGLFFVCGYVILGRGRLAAWLGRPAFPRLGRMSYSYYLCHGLTLKGLIFLVVRLRPVTSPSAAIFWIGLPVAYACTLIVAWGWFRLVETPLDTLFAARFGDAHRSTLAAADSSIAPARSNRSSTPQASGSCASGSSSLGALDPRPATLLAGIDH